MNPAGAARTRRPVALVALVLAAALLGGCYVSGDLLLDPSAAVHPLADGIYGRQGDPGDRFKLSLETDGWYAV